jgi:hypothetical protein
VAEKYCVEANWPLLAAALRGEPGATWPARPEVVSLPSRHAGDVSLPPLAISLSDSGVWNVPSSDQESAL